MNARHPLGEAKSWMLGAACALSVHGFGLAALIGGEGRARSTSAAFPIEVEIGAESEMAQERTDVAPGERQQAAAPPRPQEATPPPEASTAPQGEFAQAQSAVRASAAPPSELAPALDTTAPPTIQSSADPSHPRTASYEQILLAHLERNKRYPRAARAHHQEGVSMVRFQMDRQGRVLRALITRSAGHDLLDEEALAMLQRAQPLPAPPHTIVGSVIELTVPVEFDLR